MRTTDYSVAAAAIMDDIIVLSDGGLGPEDRDPLRTIIRIAFELQDFLCTKPNDADALEWTRDTVFSGCDSIHLACSTWSVVRRTGALTATAPEPYTFPTDLSDLARRLSEALRSVQDGSASWAERILAVNRAACLHLFFLGATLL
jgi:hypothetical protein